MKYCEDCGCKMYNGACINCHEEVFIAEQHRELGTYEQTGDWFKQRVEEQERQIAINQRESE